jgi:hypothetical protein
LYRQIVGSALERLAQHGVQAILTTTDWSNFAALRSCRAVGFQQLGPICRVGMGRRMAGFYPDRARRLSIRFGEDAAGPSHAVVPGPSE